MFDLETDISERYDLSLDSSNGNTNEQGHPDGKIFAKQPKNLNFKNRRDILSEMRLSDIAERE